MLSYLQYFPKHNMTAIQPGCLRHCNKELRSQEDRYHIIDAATFLVDQSHDVVAGEEYRTATVLPAIHLY